MKVISLITAAMADQILLKNGDRISGTVVKSDGNPNLTRGSEYRINFDTSLVSDITKRIAWQITVSDRYLSDPPPGSKQNDLILSTGLRVKLGS